VKLSTRDHHSMEVMVDLALYHLLYLYINLFEN